jgi:hypothetical protein
MNRNGEPAGERLRRANPIQAEEVEGPDSEQARRLFERITQERPRHTRRNHRRALWILIPAALLLLGAASYALYHRVTEPSVVACYQGASLDANRAAVPPVEGDPAAACRPLWEPDGQFGSAGQTPPQLVACVTQSGTIGVFPTEGRPDPCGALGLVPFQRAGGGDEAGAIVRLQGELVPRFIGTCVSQNEATVMVQEALRAGDLFGWRIAVSGSFTDEAPCASLAIDTPGRTVRLVPVPGPATG